MSRTALKFLGLVLALLGAGAVLFLVYGKKAGDGKPEVAACSHVRAMQARMKAHVGGELAALSLTEKPFILPDLSFRKGDGTSARLADSHGRMRLVNLWATWCVPCREEMPALDRLQNALGGADFEVMAINIDQRDEEKPRRWLKDNTIASLAFYADPSARVFQELKYVGRAFGLPSTMLIDAQGCEVAHLAGPADWGSERAKLLIKAALGK